VLATKGPKNVEREVEEKMAILKPGGGFVFTQVHNIVQETPPENILAMFEAFRRNRDYV
jgi:uroporphyrinogen decarboxylase